MSMMLTVCEYYTGTNNIIDYIDQRCLELEEKFVSSSFGMLREN